MLTRLAIDRAIVRLPFKVADFGGLATSHREAACSDGNRIRVKTTTGEAAPESSMLRRAF